MGTKLSSRRRPNWKFSIFRRTLSSQNGIDFITNLHLDLVMVVLVASTLMRGDL